MTEGMELLNQGKIRTLGDKEAYKYLEILDADTINDGDERWKKKLKKSISGDKPAHWSRG